MNLWFSLWNGLCRPVQIVLIHLVICYYNCGLHLNYEIWLKVFFNGFTMGTFCIDIKCPLWKLLKGPMVLQNSQNKLKLLTRWSWDKMAATLTDNIFKCNFVKDNVLIWIQISLNFVPKGGVDNKSSLVQATSHYLSQCWPRSVSPYDITRPQWVTVKSLI